MWVRIWRGWVRLQPVFKLLFFVVLGTGVYLGISSGPSGGYGRVAPLLHAGGMFTCTAISYLGFPRWRWWFRGALVFGVGVFIEIAQSFNPRRHADINDIFINGAGVLAALLAIWAWRSWNRRRNLRFLQSRKHHN